MKLRTVLVFTGVLLALISLALGLALAAPSSSLPEPEVAAGSVKQPQGSFIIPDKFLRRWDSVTLFFDESKGPAAGGPEDMPERWVKLQPAHPGVYRWLNGHTLQFKPAEPWPPLTRFTWTMGKKSLILPTLMEAPMSTQPGAEAEGLEQVENITFNFAEPVEPNAFARMVKIVLRPLPGVDDTKTQWLDYRDFEVKVIERLQRTDPAQYVLKLHRSIPAGMRVMIRLNLSLEEHLAEGFKEINFSTAETFRILQAGCSNVRLPITVEGITYSKTQALSCGDGQRKLEVVFSSRPKALTAMAARNLVRISPRVEDLDFNTSGNMLSIGGRFNAEQLYQISLTPMLLSDHHGKTLVIKAPSELFVFFPAKQKYLNWQVNTGIVERFGPQMMPLDGRGFSRMDLRIYPVDPLNLSFWPFPDGSVIVDENSRPPRPGLYPEPYKDYARYIDPHELAAQIKALGSPAVSTLVDLPLSPKSNAAQFGVDLAPHFEKISGKNSAGTYLVGIRRLDDIAERTYARVQVTDLALSTIEESTTVRFVVTSLSTGRALKGAKISLDGVQSKGGENHWLVLAEGTTDADGSFSWRTPGLNHQSRNIRRIVVKNGVDVLVLDPSRPPDVYTNSHWSHRGETWLQWTLQDTKVRQVQQQRLCHLFSERPVYRPEEPVHIKGYVRERHLGNLSQVAEKVTLVVQGPNEMLWRYPLVYSKLGGVYHLFNEATVPTGSYHAYLEFPQNQRCGQVNFIKEAYRIPDFEVDLHGPAEAGTDSEFKIELMAKYYAGGLVAGRPVRWRVTQFPYTHMPKARQGYFYSSDGRFSGNERLSSNTTLERNNTTDDQGAASIEVNPAAEPTSSPRSYIIEATVTGADDQTVTQTHRVIAVPAVVLGLKLPRFVERAKSVHAEVIAIGPKGDLLAGQNIKLRLIKREWHSHLRAGDFSQAQAKYVTEVVDKKIHETQISSDKQPKAIPLKLEGAGVYVVEVESQDRLGRAQVVAVDFYASGDEPVTWSRPPSEVFKITPDKNQYAPGETAHLVLESPFQQAQALAIIEAPEGNRYQWLSVNNGAATVNVPILKNQVPRLPVHVVLMRGRLPGVKPARLSRVDLGKPATVAATVYLEVKPTAHQLKVELDYPPKAKPGDTISMKIQLKDHDGKASAGEVTLWLVDQAVLALGKEQRLDPIPDFITPVHSRFSILDTRNLTLGILPFDEQPGGDGSASEKAELLDKTVVRKDFKAIAYYNALIEVAANGSAMVKIKLPDNLTNFKIRAKAVSGADKFGVGTGLISVRLPVLVQAVLPRFVRPGDQFSAGAIGRIVEGGGGAGQAQMSVQGLELMEPNTKQFTWQPKVPQRLYYQLRVPTPAYDTKGELSLREVSVKVGVERQQDQARDAFEVKLPLRPDRDRITQRLLKEIAPQQSIEVPTLGEAARPGSVRREVLLSNQALLVRMAAGLDYLMDYPFGCTEQQLSRARVVIALKAFNTTLYQSRNEQELDKAVQAVLTWLPGVVDQQGLVALWPGAIGYVSLTAWTVEFLVEAQQAGYLIDADLLARLTGTLSRALRSDYRHFIRGEIYTERVMALKALAMAGKLEEAYMAELARHTNNLNMESLAQVGYLLKKSQNKSAVTIAAFNKKLWEGVVIRLHQGKEIYGGFQENFSQRGALILPSEVRTLAEVVRALHPDASAHKNLPLLTTALINLGQEHGWGNTQTNAAALLALTQVMKGSDTPGPVQKLQLSHSGQVVPVSLTQQQALHFLVLNHAPKINIKRDKDGAKENTLMRVATTYIPQADGSSAMADQQGFVINREQLKILSGKQPPLRFPLDKAAQTLAYDVGDVVEEHVEVINASDRYYVAVIIPLAAGMEPLNPRLATAPPEAKHTGAITLEPSYAAYLDDHVAYYYNSLPKGNYHIYFRTRATVIGTFIQPQARAQMMYDDAVYGLSPGAKINIRAVAVPSTNPP